MVYEIKKLIDYILNNNLNIDKSLFFTIVIGQDFNIWNLADFLSVCGIISGK